MTVLSLGLGTATRRLKTITAAIVAAGLMSLPAAAQDAATPAPAASPAAAAAPTEVDPDAVVATVNGEPITERDLEIIAIIMGDQLTQYPQENWRQIQIEVAIQFKLMAAAARGEGLDQTPQFQAEMAIRAEEALRNQYIETAIIPTVTEDDLTDAYNTVVAGLDLPEEVQIAAITVATEAEANDVIRRVNNGEDFAALAFELSLNRQTAEAGGLIQQFWQPGQLIQELDDVVFTLQTGDVLQYPIQIADQWHVIKITEHRTQPPPAYEDLRATLQQQLVTQAYTARLEALRGAADIQMMDEATPAEDAAPGSAAAPASAAAPVAPASGAAAPAPAGP